MEEAHESVIFFCYGAVCFCIWVALLIKMWIDERKSNRDETPMEVAEMSGAAELLLEYAKRMKEAGQEVVFVNIEQGSIMNIDGQIKKTYPVRGNMQQFRLVEGMEFTCSVCGKDKKSKLIAFPQSADGASKPICNGCYGQILSE
jgi:hypothetical protein